MTEAEARAACWELGIIAPWYLRPSQLDVYDLILRLKFPFIEAARRFGKTNSILAFVQEQLRRNKGWIARWCFPDKNQAREVLGAEITKLEQSCPKHLRSVYKTVDSYYEFSNGSKLYIRGMNHDRGESARGPAANIIICDEYGFWTDPKYGVDSCLYPQLENQPGHWLIKASTPPENLGHIYYEERETAFRDGEAIQKILYDNESLSQEEIAEIIKRSGGVNSPAFRRERLCQAVTDPEKLIVPEWNSAINVVPDDYPMPEFPTFYTTGDSGFDDNTFVLFGYYDFLNAEVVIGYEYCVRGKTTRTIVRNSKRLEKILYKGQAPKKRQYDANKQQIYDIFSEHKWPVILPEKDQKHASIHRLRVEVGAGRFKVKRRCKNLIRQMEVGIWKDDKKLDFERTEGLGHLDGVAAAVYFNRGIDRKFNPVPQHHGLNLDRVFIPTDQGSSGKPRVIRERLRGFR